jgi:HD-GYP domain-containing protein (c-di-GMP phosphodiesterase class II)
MTSDRAYRKALPHGVAVSEIRRCAGSQFDPDVSSPFIVAVDEMRQAKLDDDPATPEELKELPQ